MRDRGQSWQDAAYVNKMHIIEGANLFFFGFGVQSAIDQPAEEKVILRD